MEKDTKQHSISYNKGITNQPSYILADDGELSSCVGLTFENGELKPVQDPKELTDSYIPDARILAVHDGRYLYPLQMSLSTTVVAWKSAEGTGTIGSYTGKVTIVGNTVIIGENYYLWNGTGYVPLGSKIPEPEIYFHVAKGDVVSKAVQFSDMCTQTGVWRVLPNKETEWSDIVFGAYYAAVNELHAKKQFVGPFALVAAVELYDGSYTLHSNPRLFLPWYGGNLYLYKSSGYSEVGDIFVHGSVLEYHMNSDYTKWSDIVKGVSLFICREIPLFNSAAGAKFSQVQLSNMTCGYCLHNNHVTDIGNGWNYYNVTSVNPDYDEFALILDKVSVSDIERTLGEEGVFFKLCDLGLHKTAQGYMIGLGGSFSATTLSSLEAQQQLPNADFHTHDTVDASYKYAYNGRLHMSGITRTLFDGFTTFADWDTTTSNSYTVVVYVDTEQGVQRVVKSISSTFEAIGQMYFFYPDPRATTAEIYANGRKLTLNLKEHPGLNGAYYFNIPTYNSNLNGYAPSPSNWPSGTAPSPNTAVEYLPNTVMVSEANNPFLFLPQGYIKVGNTSIVGMAAVTMALSEYQHGHHPLVVFTKDGIWSLSLNEEGYYVSIQAVSREVCNNASSITQVDNGIFFASAKGLMYLDTAGVKCVSAQMKGTEFDDFIDNCMIAYDYRDSLLHIYPNPNNAQGLADTYVYNMKTGTFSMLQGNYTNVVNNYPDTLVQYQINGTWHTFSLLQKPDEQSDDNYTYSGQIETRPMKFGNILTLKSIRHIRHLYVMNSNAEVSLTVTASNDGVNWTNPALTSLRGKPWKLFKFRIDFDHMHATDRYAGTVVWTQERRTEKPR